MIFYLNVELEFVESINFFIINKMLEYFINKYFKAKYNLNIRINK